MVQGGLTFPEPLSTYTRILNKHDTANSEKQVFDFFNTSQFHCAWQVFADILASFVQTTGRFLSTLWGEAHFS